MNIIAMFTAICLFNLHYLLLGSLLHIFSGLLLHFFHPHLPISTIVDWHLFVWIQHSVVTCIETHIFVSNFSIYHIYISILKVFCCFSLLWNLLAFHLKHSKKFSQHHIYTIFEKILFSCFFFGHTRRQCVTLTNGEGVFIFHLSSKEVYCIVIGSSNKV